MSVTKKYLHDVDLVRNKLMNPLLNPLTSSQRTGTTLGTTDQGYITYDTTLNVIYYWNGSAWQTIGGGSFGRGEWGSITGTLSAQTDLTGYLSSTYTPLNRNITINGITQDLSVDRTWTISGGSGTLVALPFTTDHITANGNPYLIGDVVYYVGNVYRCIANNDAIIPTNATYWTSLGAGYPLVPQPSDWNATSGNNQILNEPTIPAAQVNSDWNAISGLAEILNKPSIPAAQVNSDWNAVSGVAEILNKPTIPTVGTWGALNYPTWTTGTPFVKMTAAGTFALDTNTYLTSAVTSVGATSPITSSGGNTPTISTSMATNKLIGRSTAGVGVMEEITVGTGLSLSGGTLSTSGISGGILHGTAAGTDTYTVTITGVASYADGDAYLVRFTNGNTGGCTLNVNGLGARTLYRNNDGVLIGGDIVNNGDMLCVYDSSLPGFRVIGTAPNTLLGYVTNADSVTITKGQVVYAFGGTGDRMTVKLANNTGDATSAKTVGVVLSASIGVNQKGLIMMQGLLDGLSILPTSTWADGDSVYLGSTPGSITPTKQYAPNHLVYVGTVTTASNGSAGRMYVNIQNGYELDELHNVQAQSPSLKDTLWYDNTVTPAQWKTASIPTILGYTPIQRSVNVISTATPAGSTAGTDYVYLVSGTTTVTLPTAVGNTNRYTIKNSGVGVVSIATTSGQTIDDSASPITINTQYVSLDLISDGSNWEII